MMIGHVILYAFRFVLRGMFWASRLQQTPTPPPMAPFGSSRDRFVCEGGQSGGLLAQTQFSW